MLILRPASRNSVKVERKLTFALVSCQMPPKRKLTEPAPATRKAAPKRARKVAAASAEALELLAPRGGLSVPDAPGEEKRLARFRTSAPQATKERIERVLSQRFFNVDRQKISSLCEQFKVLGSTGNVYTVQIRNVSHCNCPDRNALCKHILFVLLKILKVPPTSPLVYQAALLDDELAVIFENAPQNAQDRVSAQLAQAYQNALAPSSSSKVVEHVEKRIPTGEDDSCPICCQSHPCVVDWRVDEIPLFR